MIGRAVPADEVETFWPLAISAPTLPTRTRSTSLIPTPASASAPRAACRTQLPVAEVEATEGMDADPGNDDVAHQPIR